MALPFFTIGHSTRSIDEFVDLLSNAEVRLVVDVRTIPRSRTNPQYNSEALAEALSESRIDYDAYCCARRPARTEGDGSPADYRRSVPKSSFFDPSGAIMKWS